MVDVSINQATNRNWQTKVLDTRKVTQVNLLRQKVFTAQQQASGFQGWISGTDLRDGSQGWISGTDLRDGSRTHLLTRPSNRPVYLRDGSPHTSQQQASVSQRLISSHDPATCQCISETDLLTRPSNMPVYLRD